MPGPFEIIDVGPELEEYEEDWINDYYPDWDDDLEEDTDEYCATCSAPRNKNCIGCRYSDEEEAGDIGW